MPHFVIECSENTLNSINPQELIRIVYDTAEMSDLFDKGDIKVRINSYKYYTIGNAQDDFIHIFANIMEVRTVSQKSNLSKSIIANLKLTLPEIPIISINIRDFEKATYCNRSMV